MHDTARVGVLLRLLSYFGEMVGKKREADRLYKARSGRRNAEGQVARELALGSSIETAIGSYDAERRPATAGVVQANRRGGPEHILQVVEERAPNGFTNLDDVIAPRELEEISEAYRRTAGFDSESLNNRPSLSVR